MERSHLWYWHIEWMSTNLISVMGITDLRSGAPDPLVNQIERDLPGNECN
jgi:hypothetical protein